MATVEKRGKYWSVRYQARDAYGNVTGQKRVSGYRSKEDAMSAARDLEVKTDAGIDVHGSSKTCGEIMEMWFLTKVGNVSEVTLGNYSDGMDILQQSPIYNTKVRQLNYKSLSTVITDLMRTRGICANTAKTYIAPLRLSLSWAFKTGIIPLNPLQGSDHIKTTKRPLRILSDRDMIDLVQMCRERNPVFLAPLLLALYGGLRREETAGLKWNAVDFGIGTVTVQEALTYNRSKPVYKEPKTLQSKRTIAMPDFVMAELRKIKLNQPIGTEYVCLSEKGKHFLPARYSYSVRNLVRYINENRPADEQMPEINYHDLRHTHAAFLIRLGLQPKVIAERLGHTSIKMTMDTYGYLMPGMQEEVARKIQIAWSDLNTKSGQKVGNDSDSEIC